MHQQRRIALYQTYLHQRREPRREPRIIHAVCFHIGYDGEDIPLQRSGAAALGLALCRNALPRPGDARMAASQGSARHEALAASCVEAACPLSSVCLCMCVQRDSGPAKWKTRQRRGNPYKDEKKHVGGLCECRCA
ncbi:hypothetical protein D4764_10G0002990 [Takifugu flavidus]|uniref:Uncharacterized protein n=1 Tax=Takifugu flavidus TaxID=433684 RepID=A0A5C6PK30_9TELE|nr:hypothetical protein D4764_10G0002990 [Takifugu flavidus]